MKILLVADDLPPQSFGGAGILAYEQMVELVSRGHEVKTITADHKKDLIKVIKDFSPDIVHAHNIHKFTYAILPEIKKNSLKLFVTLRDTLAVHYGKLYPKRKVDGSFDYHVSVWHQMYHFWRQYKPFFKRRNRMYLKSADRIFAPSMALIDGLRENGLEKVMLMRDGVKIEKFSVSTNELDQFRKKLSLENKKVLLFAGRIGGAKGSEIALDLLRVLSSSMPDARLLFVGKEGAEDIKASAAKKGVANKVVFGGWLGRDDIRLAYGIADVVLSLSVYLDPFPTVNLEAMAAGKPVVGTIYGGTPEAVQDGITGYLVDPTNLKQIHERVERLLKDRSLADTFGQAGRERVQKEFSLDQVVDELEKVYNSA